MGHYCDRARQRSTDRSHAYVGGKFGQRSRGVQGEVFIELLLLVGLLLFRGRALSLSFSYGEPKMCAMVCFVKSRLTPCFFGAFFSQSHIPYCNVSISTVLLLLMFSTSGPVFFNVSFHEVRSDLSNHS